MTGKSIETYLNKLGERYSYLEKEIQRIRHFWAKQKNINIECVNNQYFKELTDEKDLLERVLDFYDEKGTFH